MNNSESIKSKLFITLFEGQLIRTYISSDKGNLLKELSSRYLLILITNPKYESTINLKLEKFKLVNTVSVITFIKKEKNWLSLLCESIFMYLNSSVDTLISINSQKTDQKSILNILLKSTIYHIFSKFNFVKKIIRFIYLYSFNLKSLFTSFSNDIVLNSKDRLFITSLSPLRGEDILIGIYFKRKKNHVAATVRSWDNLVSNGCLFFKPKKFISHSEFMTECAIKYQDISSEHIYVGVCPSYQNKFIQFDRHYMLDQINIAYLSMSTAVNPDDSNLIKKIIDSWTALPANMYLSIIEHPAFPTHIDVNGLPINVKVIKFDFENTSLYDYYSFLARMNLVISGGTTGILDASVLGVPTVAIGFEVYRQDFWKSGLRAFDYYSHTSNFFQDTGLKIATNLEQLGKYISNTDLIISLDRQKIFRYAGNPEAQLASLILKSLD